MGADLTGSVNYTALDAIIKRVIADTGRDAAAVTNKALLSVLIGGTMNGKKYKGAVQGTRRASKAAIQKYFGVQAAKEKKVKNRFLMRLAAKRLKERNIKFAEDRFVLRRSKKDPNRVTSMKWESPYHKALVKESRKIIARAISGIGYTARIGWDKAIKELGGRGFKRQKRFSKSEARHGGARPAKNISGMRFSAIAANTAPGIFVAGGQRALDKAMENVAKDMGSHHLKRMVELRAKAAGLKKG